jgi:hypothetical protein
VYLIEILSPQRSAADKKIVAYLQQSAPTSKFKAASTLAKDEKCSIQTFVGVRNQLKTAGVKFRGISKSRKFTIAKAGWIFYDRTAKCWMFETKEDAPVSGVGPAPVRTSDGMRGVAFLFAAMQGCACPPK